LKERSKELLNVETGAGARHRADEQKFFGSFFQKRTACLDV
jgi:hypothetical protein